MAVNKMSRQRGRKFSESGEDLCPVCSEVISIFAIGNCDHLVCYRCSTRMRALCQQMYCPICRGDVPEVFFSLKLRPFAQCNLKKAFHARKHNIYCEDKVCEDAYKRLFEFRCPTCSDLEPLKDFNQLKVHVRKEHKMHFCDICVDHLKIFTFERKMYSRADLARHRRIGDVDDMSHKGHPLCEFCEKRYLDNDELLRHLRQEHYFCHLCDTHGSHQYYCDYQYLLEHFKEVHFVCEEDECGTTQFTNVFQTVIDLKAHRAQMHKTTKQRSAAKQDRMIDVPIGLRPRPKNNRRGQVNNDDYEDLRERDRPGSQDRVRRREEQDVRQAMEASVVPSQIDVHDEEDFPAISGVSSQVEYSTENSMARRLAASAGRNVHHNQEDEYPALNDNVPAPKQVTFQPKNSWGFEAIEEDFPALRGVPSQGGNSNVLTSRTAKSAPVRPEQRVAKEPPQVKKSKSRYDPTRDPGLDEAPTSLSFIGSMINGRSAPSKISMVEARPKSLVVNPSRAPDLNDFPSLSDAVLETPVTDSWLLNKSKEVEKELFQRKPKTREVVNKVTVVEDDDDDDDFPSLGLAQDPRPATWVKGASGIQYNKRGKKVAPAPVLPPSSLASLIETKPGRLEPSQYPSKPREADSDGFVSVKAKPKVNETKTNVNEKEEKGEGKKKKKKGANQSVEAENDLVASFLEDIAVNPNTPEEKPEEPFVDIPKKSKKKKGKNKENEKVESPTPPLLNMTLPKSPQISKKETIAVEKPKGIVDNNVRLTYDLNPPVSRVTSLDAADFPSLPQQQNGLSFSSAESVTPYVQKFDNHQTTPIELTTDDFPALGPAPKLQAPPGFKGALSKSEPPPGFKERDEPELEYTIPERYTQRNTKLINKMRQLLRFDENEFNKFKIISGNFRCGSIDANEYYSQCQELFGEKGFKEIFTELLVLLPDIPKQNELYGAHLMEVSKFALVEADGDELRGCSKCRQIVKSTEFKTHDRQHGFMKLPS